MAAQEYDETEVHIMLLEPDLLALRLWWVEAFGEHNHFGGATATRWFLDPLELGRNDTILDVGCFLGAALRLAARRYRCQGVGVDGNAAFVALAKKRAEKEGFAPQVKFYVGDHTVLNLPESSVNAVLSFEVPYDASAFWRILKANGRLCIATRTQQPPDDFGVALEGHGFRTERSVDATEEALSALELVIESFKEEERPEEYIKSALLEREELQKPGTYYLRWVGKRR
jgi:SAM-dependent methyltransferase